MSTLLVTGTDVLPDAASAQLCQHSQQCASLCAVEWRMLGYSRCPTWMCIVIDHVSISCVYVFCYLCEVQVCVYVHLCMYVHVVCMYMHVFVHVYYVHACTQLGCGYPFWWWHNLDGQGVYTCETSLETLTTSID